MDNQKTKKGTRDKRRKPLTKKQRNYLQRLYERVSENTSFAGASKIFNEVQRRKKYQLSLYQIRKFLSQQEAYVLGKSGHTKFNKPSYISYFKFYLIQIDLVDMTRYSKDNDNIKFLITCIDTFSRFLYIRPLQSKKASDVVEGMQKILDAIDHPDDSICLRQIMEKIKR